MFLDIVLVFSISGSTLSRRDRAHPQELKRITATQSARATSKRAQAHLPRPVVLKLLHAQQKAVTS
jgi:hypothetical protein